MHKFFKQRKILKKHMQNNQLIQIVRPGLFLLVLFFLMAAVSSTLQADGLPPASNQLALYPYSYHQDFETEDPFRKWKSNGSFKINYKGLTSERSTSGSKSFKIDITFGTATYVYWKIPMTVPLEGKLDFSGDIFVSNINNAAAALGANIDLSPFPRSGVTILPKQNKASDMWKTQRINLIDAGLSKATVQTGKYLGDGTPLDVGIYTDKIGLFLFGKKGSSITVYIDNIMVSGRVPDNEEYKEQSENAWRSYKTRNDNEIDTLVKQIGNLEDKRVKTLLQPYANRGYIFADEYDELKLIAADLNYRVSYWNNNQDIATFPLDPLTNRKILPYMYPVPAFPGSVLQINATPGEYEPASFVIRAQKNIENLAISTSDFLSETGNKILAKAVDIRLVKCWYQAGATDVKKERRRYLTPELLLKDDSLIRTDIRTQTNFLKVLVDNQEQYIDISHKNATIPENALIYDSQSLLPFDLKENENKQIWLTFNIPKDSQPGRYIGKIHIQGDAISAGPVSATLEMQITVLDFTLPKPSLEYSIYYTGKLVTHPVGVTSEYKNLTQYQHEMNNLKTHGIASATIYQTLDKRPDTALQIRAATGISGANLYVLGTKTSHPVDDNPLERLTGDVLKWMQYARQFQYENVYIYGIDEAGTEVILSQRKAWEAVHQAGAGIFVASPKNGVDVANGLLNIGVLNRSLDPDAAENWHLNGARVFSYGNPQVGVENPAIYRQNYGLDLWIAGYDGAMNFAYQYGMGHIWNDFDHERYRDHVFAYPVSNGVIDTIQWEGFREGVDDVRYLTKLLLLDPASEESIRIWLRKLKKDGLSMGQIRDRLIQRCRQYL